MDHPYLRLKLPDGAPFELKPSPGKGWGCFATRNIKKDEVILKEMPILKFSTSPKDLTAAQVDAAFQQLPSSQQAQINLVRDDGSGRLMSLLRFCNNSCFGSIKSRGPKCWVFLLRSRFNHSCVPNSDLLPQFSNQATVRAAKDISAGEEITFCYAGPSFLVYTCLERRERLSFISWSFRCSCKACTPGTTFQRASDMRQRLIRGLLFLLMGREMVPGSAALIADPALRDAARNSQISLASTAVYMALVILLIDEEGIRDAYLAEQWDQKRGMLLGSLDADNAAILKRAETLDSSREKFRIISSLWGRKNQKDGLNTGIRQKVDGTSPSQSATPPQTTPPQTATLPEPATSPEPAL